MGDQARQQPLSPPAWERDRQPKVARGEGQNRRLLWLTLLVALALRLIFGLAQDPRAVFANRSADSGWYLDNGYALVTGHSPDGVVTDVSNLAPPPIYFILIGVPQMFLARTDAVIIIRVFQAILSTMTCYFAYRLALRLTGREAAGLLVAGVLAISPVFIIESAQILTETVFIFLLTGGVWLYVEYVHESSVGARHASPLQNPKSIWLLVLAAALLGLATLTRAVLLAFPFGLALHLIMVRGWRKGWRHAVLLLVVYALVVSTWTIYSVARWNRFVIAGAGLPDFLYIGATETGWTSPQEIDQSLAQQSPTGDPVEAAQTIISADPLGWARRRVENLAEAYLQPHGTTFFPGESLRDLAVGTLHGEVSLSALVGGDAFWSKLALYLLHYVGLLAGLVGIWLYRRQWRVALPMLGVIAYLTLVHLFLYALPRYLFPAELFWWVFAAAALARLRILAR
ncbi:MAG: phospholipid carrier-dependent glycosyltransferase [Anaerolineae bacterium]